MISPVNMTKSAGNFFPQCNFFIYYYENKWVCKVQKVDFEMHADDLPTSSDSSMTLHL